MASRLVLKHKILLLVIILAFAIRIFDIENNPKSMYGDELTLVYDAYSILKTGRDQNGEFLPLYFSMGGGRPAGYIYATIPFVAIFGPTATAARMPSVLSGVGIVILLYLITSQVLSKKIGIYAAFFATITPWELSLSRGPFETHLALFLALLGLYFFYLAKKKNIWYLASAVAFALSMQTYSTYALTVPLFVLMLLFVGNLLKLKRILSNWILLSFIIIITASLVFSIFTSISRGSKDRFTNLYILNQPQLQNIISAKVTAERLFSPLKPELAKMAHNKIWESSAVLLGNFVRHFSLEFLFLQGDGNPRHNPATMGQFYFFMLPLFVMGILFYRIKSVLIFIGLWLFIAPFASSLVGEPHALRGSFMLPPFIILAALGMEKIQNYRMLKIILLVIFLIQLPFFVNRFYLLSPHLNASFWSYAAKEASRIALQNKNNFDHVILSTSIADMEFAYSVYARIDPKDFIYQKTHQIYLDEYNFLEFDNVYLGSIHSDRIRQIMNSLHGSVLYLGTVDDRGMVDNELIKRDKDGSPLFVVSSKGDTTLDLR